VVSPISISMETMRGILAVSFMIEVEVNLAPGVL
jgi:hypothetical protein